MSSQFDVLQACINGHVITDHLVGDPARGRSFCPDCGARTISVCEGCQSKIPGRRYFTDAYGIKKTNSFSITVPPRHCTSCGQAFPWQLVALEELNMMLEDTEQVELAKLTIDLTSETPRTARAVLLFKAWLETVSPEIGEAAMALIKAVGTGAVLKLLGL